MPKLKPQTIVPTSKEALAIDTGITADPDNPELTDVWFEKAKPASVVLNPEIYATLIAMKNTLSNSKTDDKLKNTQKLYPV